jgi:hypothetical protein
VIRNVVIHISNEQPLLADLFSVPSAADVALVCTNIRMMDGKKPIFIDRTDSTFFFPNLHIRFLEVPNAELARHLATAGPAAGLAPCPAAPGPAVAGGPGESAALDPSQRLPVPVGDGGVTVDPGARPGPEPEPDLDIDEGFLQRVRDI